MSLFFLPSWSKAQFFFLTEAHRRKVQMFMQTFSLLKTCLQQEVLDTAGINMHGSLRIHNSSRVKDTFVQHPHHHHHYHRPLPPTSTPRTSQECLLECRFIKYTHTHTRSDSHLMHLASAHEHIVMHSVRTHYIPPLQRVRTRLHGCIQMEAVSSGAEGETVQWG